jgi:FdhD protein
VDNERALTEIVRFRDSEEEFATDLVVKESELTIVLNGYRITSLACLKGKELELGIGYLFSEGLISRKDEVLGHELCDKGVRIAFESGISDDRIQNYVATGTKTSGCGGGFSGRVEYQEKRSFPSFPLTKETICEKMTEFQKSSQLFFETGGVHSAALFDNRAGEFLVFADDIGRHNAIDKVLGRGILDGVNFALLTLFTSGRLSSEIVKKASQCKIPLLVSRSAPTSKAIALAYYGGIYLVGFARARKFNLYSGLDSVRVGS